MASRAEDFVQSKIQIYLQIAVSSGMTHVCPECVDKDGQYFNKMVDFDRHCWEKSDQTHMSLLSKVPATFLPTYLIAMGLSEIEELPPGHDKPGRWTNERYLRLPTSSRPRRGTPAQWKRGIISMLTLETRFIAPESSHGQEQLNI
jgi:hypothetical protein